MGNKWINIVEDGNYKLDINIDVSELVIIRSDNGKDVSVISLYEEDLEKMLTVIKQVVNK